MNNDELPLMPACDVLAFGAHPDDVEIACGGTILLLRRAGMRVAVVDCTRGEMGSSGTGEDRSREAAAASKQLGLAARSNLGLADTGIRDDDYATDLAVKAIRAVRPRMLFIPHDRDAHPDHTNASNLLRRAHFLSARTPGLAHRLQSSHAALVTGPAGLDALTYPHLLFCQAAVELGVCGRLCRLPGLPLFLIAPPVSRVAGEDAAVELDDAG